MRRSNLLKLFCNFEGFFAIRVSRESSALLTADVSETRKPIFASRFTGQTGHAGNSSGNFHENPPTSAHSSNPLFKPMHDVCGSPWTRLGITGVRIPSPPAFARRTPELRLARQGKKPARSKTGFHFVGRRLSAIVRPQPNVGGPPVYLYIILCLRPAALR